jgi:pyruvate dehydrogenase E2 component (dihydrolipoamide acetyltransferase)
VTEPRVFAMPSLGADMTEGTLLEWRVAPGDTVHRGDIVAVVDTDKSDIEVEVFDDGVVTELLVGVGTKVPVGEPLALIAPVRAKAAPAARRAAAPVEAPPATPTPAAVPAPTAVPVGRAPSVLSPVLRHLADELHVDLALVPVRAADHRVHRDDVVAAAARAVTPRRRVTPRARRLAAAAGIDVAAIDVGDQVVTGNDVAAYRAPAAAPAAAEPIDTMRSAIASLMRRSWQTIPHYHVATRVDLARTLAWLTATNESRPVTERVLPAALFLHAVARAAATAPAINGWWLDERLVTSPTVNLGVVVALRGGGLIVPTIARADEMTLRELMARLTDVVGRARRGRLRSSETAPASITVTNLGDLGVETLLGIIHPPQVAIVGIGAVHDEPCAVEGQVAVHPVVHLTLGGDHRASDGLAGATFLAQVARLLEPPEPS